MNEWMNNWKPFEFIPKTNKTATCVRFLCVLFKEQSVLPNHSASAEARVGLSLNPWLEHFPVFLFLLPHTNFQLESNSYIEQPAVWWPNRDTFPIRNQSYLQAVSLVTWLLNLYPRFFQSSWNIQRLFSFFQGAIFQCYGKISSSAFSQRHKYLNHKYLM